MRRTEATAWVVSVCAASMRLSQAKTLAALATAAMAVERVSLANLGRHMLGSAKHQIKRCWRFCDNDRVEPADAMRGAVARLVRRRKAPLLVAVDWVDVRGYQTLVASAVLYGVGKVLLGRGFDAATTKASVAQSAKKLSGVRALAAAMPFVAVFLLAVVPHACVVLTSLTSPGGRFATCASVTLPSAGPITAARLLIDCSAPMVTPCVLGSADFDTTA